MASSERKLSREDGASVWSYLSLTYLNPIFEISDKGKLELSDLGSISMVDKSSTLHVKFDEAWKEESKKPREKMSLWRVLWTTVGVWRLYLSLLLFLLSGACNFVPIMILYYLVLHFQGGIELSTTMLWILVSLMFLVPMLAAFLVAHSNAILSHIGAQFRNALIGVIYRKALVLSSGARSASSTGQIVNMFSNDTNQLRNFVFLLNNLLIAPIQILVCMFLIYLQVGVATFVGVGYTIVLLPINGLMFGVIQSIRRQRVAETDMRVKLMNEIIGGIRIIKYYAWEKAFTQLVTDVRNRELGFLKKSAYIVGIGFTLLLFSAPVIQTILVFTTYIASGNALDAATAFTTLTLFGYMTGPFIFLPMGLAQYSQSSVANERILKYLLSEELEDYVDHSEGKDGKSVKMSNASLCWIKNPPLVTGDDNEDAVKIDLDKKEIAVKEIELTDKDENAKYAVVATDEENVVNRSEHTLNNIDFSVKTGELLAVVGSVGSGKSSLLGALLGDLYLTKGSVALNGSIAYCEQKPWIINANVKENIIFGEAYDEIRFQQAIFAANMEDDLSMLPAGVNTEIGERGINLSGGQKARVALARAVYRDADVYLLDDPLSAVDAHVGAHIFNKCIKTSLAKKTRILVTHHVHLLNQCDKIIVLVDGSMKAFGSYDDLIKSGLDLSQFVSAEQEDDEEDEEDAPAPIAGTGLGSESGAGGKLVRQVSSGSTRARTSSMNKGERERKRTASANKPAPIASADKHEGEQLMTIEEKREGSVPFSTYLSYIRAGGLYICIVMLLSMTVSQGFSVLSQFWLAAWGKESTDYEDSHDGDGLSASRSFYYLNIFAAVSMAGVFFSVIRSILLAHHRLGTSTTLHASLLVKCLNGSTSFFDITPMGRIINRFSADMNTIDEELSQSISMIVNTVFQCIAASASIAGATQGTFIILMIPLGYLYQKVRVYFTKANSNVVRYEAVTRSPIYADFSQTLGGTSSIRAYGQQQRFILNLEKFADQNTIPGVFQQLCAQWLAIRLDFIGAMVSFFVAALACASPGFISAGYVGLGLGSSILLTSYLKFAVRMLATGEAQMNSVERVQYYIDNIAQDGVKVTYADTEFYDEAFGRKAAAASSNAPNGKFVSVSTSDQIKIKMEAPKYITPAEDWPKQGTIESKDIFLKYRDGPLVLTGLTFAVKAGEKIGVVGRTGCGKSSVMVSLFRIEELVGGSLWIDGVDIATVPLPILRTKLCIIPQDPVMFSLTVRFNLDPFKQHSDAELWDVLDSVHMKDHVLSLPEKLDDPVSEGGDNYSTGQRQLICIARALLRKPKILIMDEATASIDNETDALIQTMIRERFSGCTILTIAHRLNTIIDNSRILVLDGGKMVEFDTPDNLLKKPDGVFTGLWNNYQLSHK